MTLADVHAEITGHAVEIENLFKAGCKVTILVRNPLLKDGDVLVSSDEIPAIVAALQNLADKEERKLTPEHILTHALGFSIPDPAVE